MIKVAIVEDNKQYRQTLVTLLSGAPGFRCVCACATAEEALRQFPTTAPDVALVDLELPGMLGAECIRRLRASLSATSFLVVTNFGDSDRIFGAIRAGACGYVLKRATLAEIVEAIRQAHEGGAPMSPEIARLVLESLHDPPGQLPANEPLTAREKEILRLAAKGRRYRAIAEELGLSFDTIRTHFRNIYQKLHVHSRAEALMKVQPSLLPPKRPDSTH